MCVGAHTHTGTRTQTHTHTQRSPLTCSLATPHSAQPRQKGHLTASVEILTFRFTSRGTSASSYKLITSGILHALVRKGQDHKAMYSVCLLMTHQPIGNPRTHTASPDPQHLPCYGPREAAHQQSMADNRQQVHSLPLPILHCFRKCVLGPGQAPFKTWWIPIGNAKSGCPAPIPSGHQHHSATGKEASGFREL